MLNILNTFYINTFTYCQGKREGYTQGRIDGYEECKKNFNRIQEFKQKILNKKLDIWKDIK